MDAARKMVLVPVETIHKYQQMFQSQTPSLALGGESLRKVNADRLENEMHQTLARPDLDDSDKWIRYRQALHGFATAARSADRSPSTDVAPVVDRDLPLLKAVAMQSVPKNAQGRAENLVRFLEATHDIKWNERGEVTIDNVFLPGSNISDLINDSLTPRKRFEPAGWRDFFSFLARKNIPHTLLSNPKRLNFIRNKRVQEGQGRTAAAPYPKWMPFR